MKKITFLLILITFGGVLILLSGCQDKFTQTYRVNEPVYMSLEAWRAMEITAQQPQPLDNPGKIYLYQQYLFIVEPGRGIHIVDNSNPSAPQNVRFLPVAGCVDVAVYNKTLYADSYYDLLAFDLANVTAPSLNCRVPDAFSFNEWLSVPGLDPDLPIYGIDPSAGIITGWKQVEITEEMNGGSYYGNDIATADGGGFNTFQPGGGMGGSMATFAVSGNYLYVVRPSSLTSYNIGASGCPQQTSVTDIAWNTETIFPYDSHLFLGTSSGMIIMGLQNPAQPIAMSQISHLTACDPVAVQGDRAYVTIRTGSRCQGITNGLLVIDVSNYSNPTQIAEYELTNPHGVGIDANTLFICDGADGLKIFDAADDQTITDHLIRQYPDVQAYDVIPWHNVLFLSSKEGIYQYDYSDPDNITELSFIPAN